MGMVITLINSFHGFYYSIVSIVSATATACVILEIAYIGIMMAMGKFTQPNEMIVKMISIGFTLFLCSHLLTFSEAMRASLEAIANKFISQSVGHSVSISMENPWSAGWTMIKDFVANLWEITNNYSDQSLAEYGTPIAKLHPKFLGFAIVVGIVKWFIRILGLLFILVIVYCMILYYMALLEYYFIVLLASIFLVFGLFQHTKFISEKCIASVFSHLVKVGVMRIILGVCFMIINITLINKIKEILGKGSGTAVLDGAIELILGMLILGAAVYYLVQNGPSLASAFVTGGVSTNGLNLMQFAAKSAGLATAGAMLAASKGAALAKSGVSNVGSIAGAASAAKTASGGSNAAAAKAGALKALGVGAKGVAGAVNLASGGTIGAGVRAATRVGSALKNSYSGGKEKAFNKFGASLEKSARTEKRDENGKVVTNAKGKTQYEKTNVLSRRGQKMIDIATRLNEKRTGEKLDEAGRTSYANKVRSMASTAREKLKK